jgi:hypothetical protein
LPREHPISKKWAEKVPPIADNFNVSREALFKFLTEPLKPEPQDVYDRTLKKLSEPKTMQEFFDITRTVSEEERYNNALDLIHQWNREYICDNNTIYMNNIKINNVMNTIDMYKQTKYLKKIEEIMEKIYPDIKGKPVYKRIQKHLEEATKNFIKIKNEGENKENIKIFMKI